MITDKNIQVTKKLMFNAQFLATDVIKTWIEKGLPNDSFSIQSAIIKHYCSV